MDSYDFNEKNLGITEISEKTDIPKSTVHRIISVLEENNIIHKNDNKYRLGLKLIQWGKTAQAQNDIKEIASFYTEELSSRHNCASHIAYLDKTNIIYIVKNVSNNFFEFSSKIGMRFPAHATALGKAILAYQPEKYINKTYEDYEFKKFTEYTIDNFDNLLSELEKVRKRGYAIDYEETNKGLKCFAKPIFSNGEKAEYAISLSGPSAQFDEKEQEKIIESLEWASRKLSGKI